MGIIDAEGRIFGLCNIVDAVALGVLTLLLIGAFRYTHPEPPSVSLPPMPEWGTRSITLLLDAPELSTMLSPGMEAVVQGTPVAQVRAIYPLEQRCYYDTLLTVRTTRPWHIGEAVTLEFPTAHVQGVVVG